MNEYIPIITALIGAGVALLLKWWVSPKESIDMLISMRKEYEENFKELLNARDMVEEVRKELKAAEKKMEAERKARAEEKRGEFASREKERQANNNRYKELEDKFDEYKKTSEYNASILASQVSTLKNELEKSDRKKLEMKSRLLSHDGQLSDLTKKVTGPLPPMK